ncbi:MAG: hypothetical protein ACR2KL_00060 [Nocardioidaceae bacterium]
MTPAVVAARVPSIHCGLASCTPAVALLDAPLVTCSAQLPAYAPLAGCTSATVEVRL